MVEKYVKDSGPSPVKWIFFAVFAALFFTDLWLVVTGQTRVVDDYFSSLIIGLRGDMLTLFFRAVTFCGDQATLTALCILVIALPGRLKIGLPVALMTGVGTAVQSLIKSLVDRPRPDPELWLIGDKDWLGFSFGSSFPSGHANTSMIFWTALMLLVGRVLISKDRPYAAILLRVIFFIFALLVGFSRLYLGVHFPSDVFGGWMLAGMLLLVFIMLYDAFWPAKWRAGRVGRVWDAMPRGAEKKRRWRKAAKKRSPSALLKFPKKRAPWKF